MEGFGSRRELGGGGGAAAEHPVGGEVGDDVQRSAGEGASGVGGLAAARADHVQPLLPVPMFAAPGTATRHTGAYGNGSAGAHRRSRSSSHRAGDEQWMTR